MNQKTLKIQYKTRFTPSASATVPMIQMTGHWLEKLGFSIGTIVMVEYDKTGIRIRHLTEAEQTAMQKTTLEFTIRKKQKEIKALQSQLKTFPASAVCTVAEQDIQYAE